MNRYLDFEKDIEKIENQILELDINKTSYKIDNEKLLHKKNKLLSKLYSDLSAWEKVQVARHADRPHAIDYIKLIFNIFEAFMNVFSIKLFPPAPMIINTGLTFSITSRTLESFSLSAKLV